MINFKQFLTESRSAPLYHTTSIEKLDGILDKGILPMTIQSSEKLLKTNKTSLEHRYIKGVSSTRSFPFAKKWINYRWDQWGVILELDQRKLAQRYEIKPLQFWGGGARTQEKLGQEPIAGNEYEEYILTETPIPFSYITRVWISKYLIKDTPDFISIRYLKKYKDLLSTLNRIRQQYGSSFIRTF